MKYLFSALLLVCSFLASAQSDSTYINSPVFLQLGVGIFPNIGNLKGEISAAVGYRFNQYVGLGAEYRSSSTHNESFGTSAKGVGLHLRGQNRRGWLAGLGGGKVLSGFQGSDNIDSQQYRTGGYYYAADVGYQFRWGGTLGLFATAVKDMTFDGYLYNNDTNVDEPTGTSRLEEFGSFGVKFGFAFPWRGKRR
ncbi:hypothetical protein [Neolewinella antarctica]|uniref:Outer membrane protein beta-barrel domain-containing protein n=1 Tax=Neolewinella antarctica TaxID=442734 RepID=A0ABX0X9B2_9BACT|nr:hypothetical protein [Neolewinella antarctica]NJC25610.1 hypothetical protein [Neolewinella antarctica]